MPDTTDRFARGSQHLVKAEPFEAARWLFALAPRAPYGWEHDIDAADDAVFVLASDGVVTRANQHAVELTGRPLSELLGSPIDLHLSGSEPRTARLHRRDGRDIPVELWVSRAADSGLVAMLRAVDSQLDAGPEAFAELAHDLKTPLSTIALEVATLQITLDGDGGKPVHDALARIGHNVDFMDRMIADLLDVALLEAGHFAIQTHAVELSAFVAAVIDRTVPTRDRDRVRFEAEGPIVASIDELRIARVVANLVGNARKYAPRDSAIRIAIERREVSARVSVIDVGPGLSPEEARFVFERYRRTESAAARHDGAGLGLFVSRKIVEAHGGRIGVSPAGQGSRFYFDLPVD